MARQTAQAFVYAGGRAIVSGTSLRRSTRRVALVAQSLTVIGADADQPRSLLHHGHGQFSQRQSFPLTPVKQRHRGSKPFLARGNRATALHRARQRDTLAMDGMTAQAGNCRAIGHPGVQQPPWAFSVDRCNKLGEPALKVHPMATKTILAEACFGIMPSVQKHLAVGDAMRPRPPLGEFALVAVPAALHHVEDIPGCQPWLFGNPAKRVGCHTPRVGEK